MLGVQVPPGLPNITEEANGSVEKIKQYFRDTLGEMQKMSWPSKDELIGSTIVTVVVSVIISIFIGVVDRVLVVFMQAIFGGGVGG